MTYSEKAEFLPIGDTVINIDSTTNVAWIPKQTTMVYDIRGIMEEASTTCAQTKQVAVKTGTTAMFTITVPSTTAIGSELDGVAETGYAFPHKFVKGSTYYLAVGTAESSVAGTVLIKMWGHPAGD